MYCLVTWNKISVSISLKRDSELTLNEILLIVTDSFYFRGLQLLYSDFK